MPTEALRAATRQVCTGAKAAGWLKPSLRAVARALGVSQPTVSIRASEVQDILDADTAALGQELLEVAQSVARDFEQGRITRQRCSIAEVARRVGANKNRLVDQLDKGRFQAIAPQIKNILY